MGFRVRGSGFIGFRGYDLRGTRGYKLGTFEVQGLWFRVYRV